VGRDLRRRVGKGVEEMSRGVRLSARLLVLRIIKVVAP